MFELSMRLFSRNWSCWWWSYPRSGWDGGDWWRWWTIRFFPQHFQPSHGPSASHDKILLMWWKEMREMEGRLQGEISHHFGWMEKNRHFYRIGQKKKILTLFPESQLPITKKSVLSKYSFNHKEVYLILQLIPMGDSRGWCTG